MEYVTWFSVLLITGLSLWVLRISHVAGLKWPRQTRCFIAIVLASLASQILHGYLAFAALDFLTALIIMYHPRGKWQEVLGLFSVSMAGINAGFWAFCETNGVHGAYSEYLVNHAINQLAWAQIAVFWIWLIADTATSGHVRDDV